MHPVVLSEASLLIDGCPLQGLNRRQHSVCNSNPWIGSQRRGKLSHAGFIRFNKKTNACSAIKKVAKNSENLYTVLLASAEHTENDEVFSTTHNLRESERGSTNQRDGPGFKAIGSQQKYQAYKQLSSLDSYFSKLHGKEDKRQSVDITLDQSVAADVPTVELHPKPDESVSLSCTESQSTKEDKQTKMRTNLNMLDGYLEKLITGAKENPKDDIPNINKSDTTRNKLTSEESEFAKKLLDIVFILENGLESAKEEKKASMSIEDEKGVLDEFIPSYDGPYNSYLINMFVAINIAVYLFGLASPVRSSDMGSVSLPLLYGAKINEMILDGQWWRLITPAFLHSGFLHVAFSSWALLTFGPLVDRAYGSLAFCMIYFLGAFCGNLMSFFHTPDATIGGTGPVFAIIGSWVVYLFQNREVIGEDTADIMIQKVFLASVLSIALSFLTPIDDWTHLGAACGGLLFGILVCPTVLSNVPSKKLLSEPVDEGQGGFLLARKPDPGRLFTVFTLFVASLVTLFFVLGPVTTEFHLSDMSDNF